MKPLILHKLHLHIGKDTIAHILAKQKLKMRKEYRVPVLSKQDKLNRVSFAIRYQHKNWKHVIFSDEKRMQLYRQNGYIRISSKERPLLPTPKHSTAVMFWGCFSWEGIGPLIQTEGNINSQQYKRILQKGLGPYYEQLPGGHWSFVQDNAGPHCPIYVKRYIEQLPATVIQWPANSPDLNLIENLWYILQYKVWDHTPTTIEQLTQYCEEEWKKISRDTLYSLIKSMPHRLKMIRELHGATLPRSATGNVHHKFKRTKKKK